MASVPYSVQGVYIVHLDSKLAHAQHYIGYAEDVYRRIGEHKKGQGARMLQVCVERGISFQLARVFPKRNRGFERRLKNRRNSRVLCPICNPTANNYPTCRRSPSRESEAECPF
jgi:predicted GIY-YIG superfamily endonuclease